ncbi:MAG: hypothetical protein EAX89_16920, partial [Candidatus Lokiarchaeota archaeon]|nr:hypothetical protein [Candidatus Lokiarchaeota archaeon]
MVGITLKDLGFGGMTKSVLGPGLNLSDMMELSDKPREIKYQNYLDSETAWFNISDCYIVDTETYNLNSKIRSIQIYDTNEKIVYFVIHGRVRQDVQNQVIQEIKGFGFEVKFFFGNSEFDILQFFLQLLKENPKPLLGQNLAHFDLGIIHSKIGTDAKNKPNRKLISNNKIYFKSYTIGSGRGNRNIYFSYLHGADNDKDGTRFDIVDTMYIAWNLFLPGSLKDLSEEAEKKIDDLLSQYKSFPKKEIDYKEFEKEELDYDAVIYSIYDVLSIPRIYEYLKSIIEQPTKDYLKIEEKASQRLCEHLWMKGHGALAESFLNQLLGRIDPNVPDYMTKYYGAICRTWKIGLFTPEDGEVGRQLDYTNEYPFGIVYQNLFDILNGDFKDLSNEEVAYGSEDYEKLLFSSTLILRCNKKCNILIEIDKSKSSEMVGFGFIRSFNNQMRVSDLEHSFGMLLCNPKQDVILTKTELEMNLELNSKFWRYFKLVKIKNGLIATSNKKTLEYIDLFKVRMEFKNPKNYNHAEIAIKYILVSVYGKLAQSIGSWFNLFCASAVTGFGRYQLFRTCIHALKLELNLVYSDTDSLYCFGKLEKIKALIDFGNQINPFPKLMFGVDNLKDEGEEILCIHTLKRKRYSKIYLKKNKETEKLELKVKIKGENGNSDYRWRDILFRLSLMTNGSLDIKRIQKNIANRNFKFRLPVKENIIELNIEKGNIKREIKNLNKKLKEFEKDNKFKSLDGFDDNLKEFLEEDGFEYNNEIYKIGEILNKKSSIESQLSRLEDRLSEINDILYNSYLTLYKRVYDEYQGKQLNEIIPELESKAKITMMYDVHFKSSINYEDFVYYSKIRKAWESETNEKAYVGCFFSINRDIKPYKDDEGNESYFGTFKPKSSKDFSYEINPQSYITTHDTIPIIKNSVYWDYLTREINVDTILLKTRNPIKLWYLSPKNSTAVTYESFCFPHNGKKKHYSFKYKPALFIKLRLHEKLPKRFDFKPIKEYFKGKTNWKEEMEKYESNFNFVNFLKEDKGENYVNCHLFIQNLNQFEISARINKFRMFCKKPDIFNIYETIDKLSRTIQILVERMFELRKIKIKIPRLTFLRQLDICQETTEKFSKSVWFHSWGKKFPKFSMGEFLQCNFLKYMSLTVYHKERSARNKLIYKKMEKFEEDYFKGETGEPWRSEIKFKLQRNFYESLSYAYILSIIKQEHFLNFIKEFNKIKQKKIMHFDLDSKLSGKLEFNSKKCLILFNPEGIISSEEIFENIISGLGPKFDPVAIGTVGGGGGNQQVHQNIIKYQEYPLNTLDDRGSITPPPQAPPPTSHNYFWEKNYEKIKMNDAFIKKWVKRDKITSDKVKIEFNFDELLFDI